MSPNDLAPLLLDRLEDLRRFLRKNASPRLLRFESLDDLLQGVQCEALAAAGAFEYRSDPELGAWLFRIARRFLLDRMSYWLALKRRASRIVRLAGREGAGTDSRASFDPAGTATSPSSFAARREDLVRVTRAMLLLPERDRDLLQWASEGLSLAQSAGRLGISYEAAERARLRALERLRKAVRLLTSSASS